MRKFKLPQRELEICNRLKEAREYVPVTQAACAQRIGIERSTLSNYEGGLTPVRYEVALRFCRQLIISEEWLATGKCDRMRRATVNSLGMDPRANSRALDSIFVRQCMDLLAEPVVSRIPHNTLFSEAFDKHLSKRYAELAERFIATPRIVSDPNHPEPLIEHMLIGVLAERWLKMLANEAQRKGEDPWPVQKDFSRRFMQAGLELFRELMGFAPARSRALESTIK